MAIKKQQSTVGCVRVYQSANGYFVEPHDMNHSVTRYESIHTFESFESLVKYLAEAFGEEL